MIDLEKERKAFEAYMNRDECEKDDVFVAESNGWVARAMFENEEIERLSSKHGSAIGKLHFTERKLVEAQQEISELKDKLAKYESGDVVLVPKEPTQVMIDKGEGQLLDLNENVDLIYQAMIEAGEIK
jgi:hypothetical protein